jgi:hypothetical protein
LLGKVGSIEMDTMDADRSATGSRTSLASYESGDLDYRCACELAAIVEIELNDG